MPTGDGPYSLLAMQPAGEAVLVRDDRHRIYLVKFNRRREQHLASVDDVDVAVHKYGWDRVQRDFPSWPDLDRYRLERATEGLNNLHNPEIESYDRRDVEVILRQIAAAGPERRDSAERLLTDLALLCTAVRTDHELAAEVAAQLDAVRRLSPRRDEPAAAPPSRYGDLAARINLAYGLDLDEVA